MSQIKFEKIDTSTPVDMNKAVEGLGGDPKMYFMLLSQFEPMNLIDKMKCCMEAYDGEKFEELKDNAHGIKGASGYIGASHIHYACYFIQEHFVNGRFQQEMEYYPTLVEAVIEFRTYSRKLIAEYKGESYEPLPEHETTSVSSKFHLSKDESTGRVYCLKEG